MLYRGRPLDEQLDGRHALPGLAPLAERDRALARRIVATVLRRLGTLRRLIGDLLSRGLPAEAPRVETALLIGAAQIMFLDVPDHAAVDLSVRLVQADRRDNRYAGLVNAVLRRIARGEGAVALAKLDPLDLDTPEWLLARWVKAYGADTAHAIARANRLEPPLDLTVKADPELWAAQLGGIVTPTGSVRLASHGPIAAMPGYGEGAWWVQDAAAALPARLFGDLSGRTAADLCAAPGGKTAQLVAAGAAVTAVDRAEPRLGRLRENLDRLGLAAATVAASRRGLAGRPVRRRAGGCALHLDRHHPPPSRHSLAQGGVGYRRPVGTAKATSPQRGHVDAAGRHHRVLHLLAGAGRRRGHRRRRPRRGPADRAKTRCSGAIPGPRRPRHRARRSAHAAVPLAGSRPPHVGPRRLLCGTPGAAVRKAGVHARLPSANPSLCCRMACRRYLPVTRRGQPLCPS